MSFVISQFKKIMRESFVHFGKKENVAPSSIQIMIQSADDKANPRYLLLKDYQPEKQVAFLDILNVSFDFTGKQMIAEPFLQSCLKRISKETDNDINKINIMIFNDAEDKTHEPRLYLYNGSTQVRELDFENDIFA